MSVQSDLAGHYPCPVCDVASSAGEMCLAGGVLYQGVLRVSEGR